MTTFYLLINEAMPGLVKIGKTDQTVQKRMKGLHETGVPLPFICKYAVQVDEKDKKDYEKLIHKGLTDQRVSKNREFFRLSFEYAISLMEMIPGEDVTPRNESEGFEDDAEREAVERYAKRRPPFSFREAKIKRTFNFFKR